MNKNIESVSHGLLCSACGACLTVCHKQAITFETSSLGRKYAIVNHNLCVNCGLCMKVCPTLDVYKLHTKYENPFIGNVLAVKVGQSNDDKYFKNAQSGGVCASILDFLFAQGKIDGALVCKMDYGNTPKVKGTIISSREEIYDCQKSCYTQVELLTALSTAKDKKSLAVVGLPCHIEGSLNLSMTLKRYENIKYRIGLICDRSLCEGIQEVIKQHSFISQPFKIDWRRKHFNKDGNHYTYKKAPLVAYTKSKEEKIYPNYYRFALKDMFTAPRCRVCYDKLNVHCDIMLGDPWGMSGIDWDKGASVIVCRTNKGKDIIDSMESLNLLLLSSRSLDELLTGQLMSKREKQVRTYSKALDEMNHNLDSYIYSLYNESEVERNMLSNAKKEILRFLKNESKSKTYNLRKANELLAIWSGNINVVVKLWYKIKKLMKL